MTFSTQNLAGNRVVVSGVDINGKQGTTVVDSSEWTTFKKLKDHDKAHAEFDATVEAFFAPITEAAERLQASHDTEVGIDPVFSEVVSEAVEGVEGRDEVRMHLSKDSVILKLIEAGQSDRLIWVNDELEILESVPTRNVSFPAAAETENADGVGTEPTA